jgi:TolB-like protein/Tfp pilus assembly protein PilF
MSFFDELKRRRVFRVAASYAVVAFVIMQLVEILFPMFNFPQWTQQFVVIVVILGFPVSVVLSWIFDKTPQGYIKTDADKIKVDELTVKVENRPFYSKKRNLFLVCAVFVGVMIGSFGSSNLGKGSSLNSEGFTKMAVLPFDNIRNDEENDFLGFALSDEIINRLGYLKSIVVRPSGSVRKYQGSDVDLNKVKNDLDVELIVTGNFMRDGDQLRLSIELIDMTKNERLWNKTVQVDYDNVFKIQNDISNAIVDGLKYELEPEEINLLESKENVDPVAYDYYLRSKSSERIEGLTFLQNVEYKFDLIDKAIKIDPNFGDAWSLRGRHANVLSRSGINLLKYEKIAAESYSRSIILSPNSFTTIMRSSGYFAESGNVEKSTEMLLNGMNKSGGSIAGLYSSMGYILRYAGFMNESIGVYKKSLDLDKTDLTEQTRLVQMGKSYIYQKKYSDAKNIFNAAIKKIKKHRKPIPDEKFYQAMPYIYLKENDNAEVYLKDVINNNDMGTWVLISQAYLSLINGNFIKGMEYINSLEKIGITDSEMKYRLVHFYIMMNDETKALKALEESVDGGFFCYSYIKSDPLTLPIHNHPKFKRIVEKAKIRHELYEKRFGDDIRSLLGMAS